MQKVASVLAAALITLPLAGLPAWGAACPTSTSVTPGTTVTFNGTDTFCSIDGLTFSNVLISVTNGSIGGTPTLHPLTIGDEIGLQLSYLAGVGTNTDFTWDMTVSGNLIGDAFALLTGAPPATLSEDVTANGNPSPPGVLAHIALSLPGTPSQTVTFTPQSQLVAIKDQFTGAAGEASSLFNGFSSVPGPIAGAGLPGLIAGCGALLGLARRRRRQQVA